MSRHSVGHAYDSPKRFSLIGTTKGRDTTLAVGEPFPIWSQERSVVVTSHWHLGVKDKAEAAAQPFGSGEGQGARFLRFAPSLLRARGAGIGIG